MSCTCCLKRKYINLFNKKDGKFPEQNEILNAVLGACDEHITILYKNCLLGHQDIKLRTFIFTEMIKITGADYMLIHDSKIKSLSEKRPLLHFIVQVNNIAFMCILIKNGVNIHSKNNMQQNVLHICAGCENANLLKYFLDKKVNIDELDIDGETPLAFALSHNHFEIVEILIKNGADLLIKSDNNVSSIDIIADMLCNDNSSYLKSDCCLECKRKSLIGLLDLILKRESQKNNIPYFHEIKKILSESFIKNGDLEYIKLLVNHCDNIIDDFNMIENSFESYNRNKMEILKYLISSDKYNYMHTTNDGVTILDYILLYSNYECAEIILEKHKDILDFEKSNYLNNNNNKIYTIFDYLFIEDNIIIDINIKKLYKNKKNITKILKLLISYGLDINEAYGGYLPIEYAIRYSDCDILKNMIELGANIHLEIIKKQAFTIFGNNDLLSCAVKFNKFSELKFLIDENVIPKYIKISELDSIPICLITSIMKDNYHIFSYLYEKYIDKENINIRKYLIRLIQMESLDNTDDFMQIMKYELSSECSEPEYVDRLIQRFIPFHNDAKGKIYLQIYEFITLIISFLDYDNNMYAWVIMDKYNFVLDLIAPNNDLLYSFIDILTYVGGFQSDFIIKKYLSIINNLIEENNDKIKKSLSCDSIRKFSNYVEDECLLVNFIKIKNFGVDVRYKLATTSEKDNFYNNLCQIPDKIHNIQNIQKDNLYINFDIYTCNNYNCTKCNNIFHKENTNFDAIFVNTQIFHKIKEYSDKNKILQTDFECEYIDSNLIDIVADNIYSSVFDKNGKRKNRKKKKKSSSSSSSSSSPSLRNSEKNKITKKDKKQIKKMDLETEIKLENNNNWTISLDDFKETLSKNIISCYQENNYHNSTEYIIKKKLFKLYFPIKLEHYERVYNQLLEYPIYDETNESINFEYNNKSFIIFKTFKTSKFIFSNPTRWIKYYAPNIGKNDKWDFDHEIPFWIDNIICKMKCYEEEIDDVNNKDMKSKLFYFPGMIYVGNYIAHGVFEYFINGTGTIFHRMFRQFHKLTPRLQTLFTSDFIYNNMFEKTEKELIMVQN
jgi:ankyrin repeat protein